MNEASSSRKRSSDFGDQAVSVKRSKSDQLKDETQHVLEILRFEDKRTNVVKVRRKLNKHFANENRIQLVIEEVLADQNEAQIEANTNNDKELLDELTFNDVVQPRKNVNDDNDNVLDETFFQDLALLISLLKAINPDLPIDENLAYEALAKCPIKEQRVGLTLQELLNKNGTRASGNSDRQPENSAVKEEETDPSLEATINFSDDEQENGLDGEENLLSDAAEAAERNIMNGMMESIVTAFPDVEREWLRERLTENRANSDCLQIVSNIITDSKYPKEAVKAGPSLEELRSLAFEVDEFLKMYPDPISYFHRADQGQGRPQPSDSYIKSALYELGLEFPQRRSKAVEKVFRQSMSYSSARKILIKSVSRTKVQKEARDRKCEAPKTADEGFYKEFWFAKNEDRLKKIIQEREATRQLKMNEARKSGILVTCPICYDDEVLPDEVLPCKGGHEFCLNCVKRSAEVAIGEGRTRFPCLSDGKICEQEFSSSVLLAVLPQTVYNRVLDKKLEEDFKNLGEAHPDLVQCPFCVYVVSMPNPNDKVLKCMNPDCLKETCRFCKELNHVPLSCKEHEKDSEMDFRKKVEMDMAEAMIRTCPKCKKRFYKTEGCNMMTCPCGMKMCYICRKPNINHRHFDNLKCVLHTNNAQIHNQEIQQAAEKAKAEYLQKNPNANLKFDPSANLKPQEETMLDWGPQYQPMLDWGPQFQPRLDLGPQYQPRLNWGPQYQPRLNWGPQYQPRLDLNYQLPPFYPYYPYYRGI